jgi:DNA (cytosine-5)-methyltransferase 1
MRDFGYDVSERILEGKAFGAMENRKRMCAVAVTKGLSFNFEDLEMPEVIERKVSEILDPIAADDPVWSEMPYLKTKEVSDKAAGKSFARQELTGSETGVPTVTRGYQKRRSTDPMLVNPENPNLLRLFTPGEHARIKGVPEHLITGLSATRAHEVLGQGICYAPFFAVGKLIGKAIKSFSAPVEAVPVVAGQQFELLLAA